MEVRSVYTTFSSKYYRTRFNLLGRRDWLNIVWKPAIIAHTTQTDGTSCGVFVMEVRQITSYKLLTSNKLEQNSQNLLFTVQMARQTIESFPAIPEEFHINPDRKNIARLRRQMAEDILHASGNVSL